MTNQAHRLTGDLRTIPPAEESYGTLLRRAVGIVIGATVLIFLIFVSSVRARADERIVELVSAFVYSACIALPSLFLLTWVSQHPGRFARLILFVDALLLIGTSAAGCFAGAFLLQAMGIVPRHGFWLEYRQTYPFALVISLAFGLSITMFETIRFKLQRATLALRTKEVEQERANKLLAEARLSSLESRIHPHFLFNTLNSISSLISTDPRRAEDTVAKLASLLRFSLKAQRLNFVSLGDEVRIVRDYLEIERTRFGARIQYEITVPDSLNNIAVPPLALQSLVENCVKHIVAQRPQTVRIEVKADRIANRILLEVRDNGPGFSLSAVSPEHGLGNVMARLDLLFGPEGQLQIAREKETTAVRISFPA